MRHVVVLALLAACDLRPAPKLAPVQRDAGAVAELGSAGDAARLAPDARTDVVATPTVDAAVDAAIDAMADAAVDAMVDDDAGAAEAEPTADCVTTAQQIANVVIDGVDPGVRGHYEQGRANIVRLTAAACTTQRWSADKQQCFRVAKLDADIRACEAMYPKPQ